MKIVNPFGQFTLTDTGDWLWKGIVPKRKQTIRERPQIRVVEKIEEVNKKVFDQALSAAARDIIKYLV